VFRDEIKKNTIFYRIPPPKYGGMAIQMGWYIQLNGT
jgi:hypothetical protein